MHPPFRIGHGYDIHQTIAGRPLILGGVHIPHPQGLLGHSDADCLSHAIADALLGAAGLPDIGHYFPNTDPNCAGMDSQLILRRTAEEIARRGYTIGNIDATLIAQTPRIAPYLEQMRQTLAQSLAITGEQIGLKATTNEHLDDLGQSLGIAAHAVALIQRHPQAQTNQASP